MNKNRIFLLFNVFVSIMCSSSLFAAQPASQQPKEDIVEIPAGGIFLPKDEHPLHTAIKDGDLKQVEALITKESVLLYTVDKDENTPLHLAAKQGNINIVYALLKKYERYDINNKNSIDQNSELKKRSLAHLKMLNKEKQSAADIAQKNSLESPEDDKQMEFFLISANINASIKYINAKPLKPGSLRKNSKS